MWQWQNLTQTNEKNPPPSNVGSCFCNKCDDDFDVHDNALPSLLLLLLPCSYCYIHVPCYCYYKCDCNVVCAWQRPPPSFCYFYYVVVATWNVMMVDLHTNKQKKTTPSNGGGCCCYKRDGNVVLRLPFPLLLLHSYCYTRMPCCCKHNGDVDVCDNDFPFLFLLLHPSTFMLTLLLLCY
jgi:hypothetical protein